MTTGASEAAGWQPGRGYENPPGPLVIATILREEGTTGVDTHVRELTTYLSGLGQPASLVTPFSLGTGIAAPVFGVRFAIEPASRPAAVLWYRHWHIKFLRAALSRVVRDEPAVIYAQGPEAAMASLRARRSPAQKVVMAVHYQRSQADGWARRGFVTQGGRAFRAIEATEREVASALDGVVFVSRSARDHMLAWLPELTTVRSTVVSNFVRSVQAPHAPAPFGDLVTVGALERDKDHDFLLRVLAAAKAAGRPYTLDIFGDGQLRRALAGAAARYGVADQVRFRGFRLDVRQMLPGYRAYVHACAVETGPISIIEALAAGLPVLAPGRGGVPELISDGVEGRFWPLDDPGKAASMLSDLLDDEHARSATARAAAARFRARFETSVVAPRLLEFLHQT